MVLLSGTASAALSSQAKRLVALRFLIYTGFQSSYFIGVVGTLTYSDGATVASTSIAVLLMNVFVILGSFCGGALLDARGPRMHFFTNVAIVLASGILAFCFATTITLLLACAGIIGFAIGFSQVAQTSYPAYLTDSAVELKKINSVMTTASNVSVIVGPSLGGIIAAQFGSRAVFVAMMLFALAALIPGIGFKPLVDTGTAKHKGASDGQLQKANLAQSVKTVFASSVLALLFWVLFLTNFGYGAFDPLESFFYRDVLHVGVEWMGWLSSASGIGAVLGALVVLRLPGRFVNVRALLVALMLMGLGCLIYVGTPFVYVAFQGQIALGIAYGAIGPLHTTIVQASSPLDQLGRVNSVMNFGSMFAGVAPLAIAPWLAEVFGVQQTLIGASAIVAATPMVLLLLARAMPGRFARMTKTAGKASAAQKDSSRN